MIDLRVLVIVGLFFVGRVSALIPATASGIVCSMCAAFLAGYAARRLLDAAYQKESGDV